MFYQNLLKSMPCFYKHKNPTTICPLMSCHSNTMPLKADSMHNAKYSRAEAVLGRVLTIESKYAVLRWMVWLNPRENSEFTE